MSRNFIFCKSRTRSRFSSKGWAKRLGKQGQHTFRSECGVVEDAISPATACTNYQHNLAAGQKMLRPAWARAVLCRPGDAGNALFTVEERGLPIVCFLCFFIFCSHLLRVQAACSMVAHHARPNGQKQSATLCHTTLSTLLVGRSPHVQNVIAPAGSAGMSRQKI